MKACRALTHTVRHTAAILSPPFSRRCLWFGKNRRKSAILRALSFPERHPRSIFPTIVTMLSRMSGTAEKHRSPLIRPTDGMWRCAGLRVVSIFTALTRLIIWPLTLKVLPGCSKKSCPHPSAAVTSRSGIEARGCTKDATSPRRRFVSRPKSKDDTYIGA